MFYYAEYVSDEPFDQAMARYAKMPGVKEWEERMHKFQKKLPGASAADDVWYVSSCRVLIMLQTYV